jgi:hypothetical protein
MLTANRFIPLLSIHPSQLFLYGEVVEKPVKKYYNEISFKNLACNKNTGILSENARKKAKRAINYLLYLAREKTAYNYKTKSTFKFKINFLTLTLPSRQQHDDTTIKNILLNQFLLEAKIRWNLSHYVWKAERQKNGNIHFHILCDCFIPWMEARNVWNRICNKLGYVDEYEKINHKKNPNSTDIHSIKNVKNVAAYVTKYMIKNDKLHNFKVKRSLHAQQYPELYIPNKLSLDTKIYLRSLSKIGRIWSCSYALTKIKGGIAEVNSEIEAELIRLKKCKDSKVIDRDYFTGIYYNQKNLTPSSFPILSGILESYIRDKFGSSSSSLILNR